MIQKARNLLTALLLSVLLSMNVCWGLPIANFYSNPLGLSQVIGPTSGTATFSFDVDLNSIGGQYGYLNVVSGSSWLVQNVPLYLSPEISSQRNHVWFHDFDGLVQESPLITNAIINDQPFSSVVSRM